MSDNITPEMREEWRAAGERLSAAVHEFHRAFVEAATAIATAVEPFVRQMHAEITARAVAGEELSVADMDALKPGQRVVDAHADVHVKRADGLWKGFECACAPLTSVKLHKYGPIRLWTGVSL